MADGRIGVPDFAPYDVIHVGATAPQLPKQVSVCPYAHQAPREPKQF